MAGGIWQAHTVKETMANPAAGLSVIAGNPQP
jgi:hypothetical protein